MLYQRKIARAEVLAAKLEFQLQQGRYALVSVQAMGIVATTLLLWFQMPRSAMLGWAMAMLLLLVRSVRMSRALTKERYHAHAVSVFWGLLLGAIWSGASWSISVYWLNFYSSNQAFDLLLLVVAVISVATIAVTSVVREVYLAQLFTTLIPIASLLAWEYEARPSNLVMAVLLTGLALLMALVSGWMSRSFGQMVESRLEHKAMTEDFAGLSESLRLRNVQLQEARKQLTDIANVDALTGLRNRRGVNRAFETEISSAKRAGTSLAFIMIDVDFFKLYNDTYGHPAGDEVLQRVAEVLLAITARAGEVAVRMGGEEFLLLLPGSTEGNAVSTAEQIKQRVEALKIPHDSSPNDTILTVSQGVVAVVPDMHTSIRDLLEAADRALYASKEQGRNTITLSTYQPMSTTTSSGTTFGSTA